MMRFSLLALVLALAACSTPTTSPRVSGPQSIGDLRIACQQGNRSACNAVQAHDGLL